MYVKYNNEPKGKLVIAKFGGIMEADKKDKTILLTGRTGVELDAPFVVLEAAFNAAVNTGQGLIDLTDTRVEKLREAHRPKPPGGPGSP